MAQNPNLNLDLLRYLKAQEKPVLPTEIEEETGLDHSTLIESLEDLAATGYEVEFHPYLGVRLVDIPDRLLEHEITEGLNTKVVGQPLHLFDTCSSTNDEAWEFIEKQHAEGKNPEESDGALFISNHQSSARGRMGRAWSANEKVGIYLSFIARTKVPADKMPYITSSMALAVANTIEQFVHLPATIKWPNDVLIGGRKVAGILVESRSQHDDTFVIGIGLNVNHRVEDFPENLRTSATSLRIERKSGPIHRIRLLRGLVFYIDNVYAQLKRKRFERIGKAWAEYVDVAGKSVHVRANGEDYAGVVKSLDPGEGLMLTLEGGEERHFKAEHVVSVRESE